MLLTVRTAKGLGNSAIYVRFRDAAGRFWDFANLLWSPTEVSTARAFLLEYPDSDALESRYQATASAPTAQATAEYVRISDGRVLAEDGAGYLVDWLGLNAIPLLQRIAGLGGANRVLDQEVMDGSLRVISARIRTYGSATDALSSGTSGLLATYTVSASYGGSGETTLSITEQLP
jgi:hypothetical protein